MPWLNRVDADWLAELVDAYGTSSCSRTTRPWARSATRLRRELDGARRRPCFGVEGWPACGTPPEALRFHGLDGASLAARIAVGARRAVAR